MLNIPKHQSILVQILKDIYQDKEIVSDLGLKGGTAAYFLYNLPRFSVDLDFDLLEKDKKDIVFSRIESILKNYGKIKEKQEKRFTLFFLLSYNDEERNIKVEISKRSFGSRYEMKRYLGIPILVMKKEDMFAHKLVALSERKTIANRDLFDLWFFAHNNWGVNEEIVKVRTKMNFKNHLKKCLRVVEKVDERYILQGIGDLLDENQKKWAKENLKKEVLFWLKYYLKQV